jgi:hypothetical protein
LQHPRYRREFGNTPRLFRPYHHGRFLEQPRALFERKWTKAAGIPAPELGRQLEDMLTRYGFTSVFDLSSLWENTRVIPDRIESGEVPGPRIRSTGGGDAIKLFASSP